MTALRFKQVIIMGIGTVAAQCAVKVKERFDNVLFFESRSDTVMTQEKFCLNKGINYRMGGVK